MRKTIGLTGPTGAGKSLLSSTAERLGFQVINCDLYARKAVEKGSEGLLRLAAVFGEEILNPDDTLNRKALAQKAFSSKENTELLNKMLLPYIVRLVNEGIKGEKVLLDAPTLFESGIFKQCDFTVAVLADREIRLERITERDSISREDALLRINAGKDDEFYKRKSDYILYNNDDIKRLEAEFEYILNNGGKNYE